jgi:hypothetical protein
VKVALDSFLEMHLGVKEAEANMPLPVLLHFLTVSLSRPVFLPIHHFPFLLPPPGVPHPITVPHPRLPSASVFRWPQHKQNLSAESLSLSKIISEPVMEREVS